MSLADDKRGVFTTIGSYNSLNSQGKVPKQTDTFSSINNKNDTVSFLLDVLKVVAGSVVLTKLIGGLFSKLVDDSEPKMKESLNKQFTQSNASEPLPSSFKNNGINVPVKTIDSNGKLKVDPNSSEGNLIYGSGNNFNKVARSAIISAGVWVSYNTISMKYNASTDKMQFKPNLGSGNPTIGEFFTGFINDTELINKKELMSSVMDNFYGTLTKNQDKSIDEIYSGLQTDALLAQVLDDNDSFTLSPEENDRLLEKARELANGVVSNDLGCGLMPSELGFNDFNNIITSITGSTDAYYIGDQLGSSIDKSTAGNEELSTENKETIKDNFFHKIINIFTVKMLEAVTTAPQIRVLFGMMNSLQNNGDTKLDEPNNDMKNNKICIKCMSREIMKIVVGFIFAIAISYLIKLLKPVIKRVLKEKINQYVGILKSLTGANK